PFPYPTLFRSAQRFLGDRATPTLLALVSTNAQYNHVALLWQGSAAGSITAAVERRTESSGWQRLGTAVAEGLDRLRYDDRDVTAGTRYGYRLSYMVGGTPRRESETRAGASLLARWARSARGSTSCPCTPTRACRRASTGCVSRKVRTPSSHALASCSDLAIRAATELDGAHADRMVHSSVPMYPALAG